MTGKNKNPLLGWRPPAELSAWARDEAERRGGGRGALSDLLTEALEWYKQAAEDNLGCPHPKARVIKGLCRRCGTFVGEKAG